ncbi:MAG: glutamate--cysteine ligase, partial [Gammaproteobacteria bacterium]
MSKNIVPHLTTALRGPLPMVEGHLQERQTMIESWFRARRRDHREPFYTSVDVRNAGYKTAPVDTNLFPAGINNLNPDFEPLCIQAVQLAIERMGMHVDRIMIIPESHTRNRFYLENVAALQEIIEKAGFEVHIGSMLPDLAEPMTIDLDSGRKLRLEPLQREQNRLHIGGFIPDLVILNNDL